MDSRLPTPRSLIATANSAPPAASRRARSRIAKYDSGTPIARATSSGVCASAPVTEACMLNTSAVAPAPAPSSIATSA